MQGDNTYNCNIADWGGRHLSIIIKCFFFTHSFASVNETPNYFPSLALLYYQLFCIISSFVFSSFVFSSFCILALLYFSSFVSLALLYLQLFCLLAVLPLALLYHQLFCTLALLSLALMSLALLYVSSFVVSFFVPTPL